MAEDTPKPEPGFIGEAGGIFQITYRPLGELRCNMLYLPPFAEEMNRCRAAAAAQARWFAARGAACCLLDYRGTGESRGELSEASISDWLEDIATAAAHLQSQASAPLVLWGCRTGALLALHFHQQYPAHCTRFLFWQPVMTGSSYVKQLLRQRVAASLGRTEGKESTADIQGRLDAGETVEIGGYPMANPLLQELAALKLSDAAVAPGRPLLWLEHQPQPDGSLPPASERTIGVLDQAGYSVSVHPFSGPPFWQLHERDRFDPLLQSTQEGWQP